jgi:cyclophilin family peptidyl-prolyl cis-trans isomerase/HEAT repeat protein
MAESMRRWRARPVAALLLLALGGCAGHRPSGHDPRQPRLTDHETRVIAELLEAEERRDFHPEFFAGPAQAPEPAIRAQAAISAGRTGAAAARPYVRHLLSDADTAVAAAAAFASGQLRDTAAVAILGSLLVDPNRLTRPTVAAEAAAALGKIATPEARDFLLAFLASAPRSDRSIAPVLREALLGAWRAGETGPDSYAPWLSHPAPEVRRASAYGLSRPIRPSALPSLLGAASDPDPLVRSYAIRGAAAPPAAAGESVTEEPPPRIAQALADTAYQVRIEAVRALGSYSHPSSISALRGVLEAGGLHERAAALESLGRIGAPARVAFREVRGLVGDARHPVALRAAALETIVRIDPHESVPILHAASTNDEWRLRTAVARALGVIGQAGRPDLERMVRDRDGRVGTAALRELVAVLGSDSLEAIRPLLIETLGAGDPFLRAVALEGLATLRETSLLPLFLDAYDRARHDSENVASLAAVDALATLGSAGSVDPSRSFLARFGTSPDFYVHRRVVDRFGEPALRTWGDPGSVRPFTTSRGYLELVERWRALPPGERDLPRVRIETDRGPIELLLYGDVAPITTANFLRLAEVGFFDGQEWPRVVPNFVVQGGDPRGDTSGGPGYTIPDELNRTRYRTGTVGMALSGPGSGGSQFFITHSPQPHLDGIYSVFGEVLIGGEVLQELMPGDRIRSVRQISSAES